MSLLTTLKLTRQGDHLTEADRRAIAYVIEDALHLQGQWFSMGGRNRYKVTLNGGSSWEFCKKWGEHRRCIEILAYQSHRKEVKNEER